MRSLRLVAVLACCLLAWCLRAGGAAAQAPDLAFEVVPLLSQVAGSSLLELSGYEDRLELGLPVPATGRLVSAELRLNFVNSRNLDIRNSRVSAEINGQPLGNLPLRNDGEVSRVILRLPVELFKPAGNRLVFTSELRTGAPCGPITVRELWAQADPVNSYLLMTYQKGSVSPTLAALDPGAPLADPGVLAILTVGNDPRPAILQAVALAAEGFALRHGDRPLRIAQVRVSARAGVPDLARALQATLPGLPLGTPVTSMLLGTDRELQPLIGPVPQAAGGSRLRLVPGLGTGEAPVLVASGVDDAALFQAALRLSDLTAPLPNQPAVSFGPAQTLAHPPSPTLVSGQEVALGELGFSVRRISSSGRYEPAADIEMPMDFYALDNRKAELILDYDFVPNLSRYAVINVLVNGQHVTHVPLDDADGGQIRGKRVTVLLNSFRPGINRLVFEASLGPDDVAACHAWKGGESAVTILPTSKLRLPVFARAIQSPDLSLLATTGFPFSRQDPARPSALLLADPSPQTFSSALMLLARTAQMIGRPLPSLQITLDAPRNEADLLVVGPVIALPDNLLAAAPIASDRLRAALDSGPDARPQVSVPAPGTRGPAGGIIGTAQAAESATGVLSDPLGATGEYARRLQSALPTTRFRARVAESTYFPVPTIPFDGVVLSTLAAPGSQRTFTFVTGADPTRLSRAVSGLIDAALWDRIDGDIAGWRLYPQEMVTARLRERVPFAEPGRSTTERILFVTSFLADRPVYWLVGILVWLTLLAILTWFWLGRVMRQTSAGPRA
ncbi:MAG: cellulose biosynthesis cyclic di-GMP-binding regulatory protein BcsB [Geminicoccaceae bacterium]